MLEQVITAGPDEHEEVILAIVAVLATTLTLLGYAIRNGIYAKAAAKDSKQTNAAVNHVEYGERRLYEVVKSIEDKQDEFDRKWGNLPAEMGDAVGLVELLHDMSHRIDILQAQLAEHVAWEMSVKYPKEVTP